ncbi:MAG: hypothetical protein HYV28_18220 [Ignavibacteriales bacterium]|nr:hypothetical protein [Ignavibacteriales bacterium]
MDKKLISQKMVVKVLKTIIKLLYKALVKKNQDKIQKGVVNDSNKEH